MNIINGRPMSTSEISSHLNEIKDSLEFNAFLKELKEEYTNFSLDNLKIKGSFIGDLYDQDNKLNISKMMIFSDEDNKLNFHSLAHNEVDNSQITYVFGIDLVIGNNLKQIDFQKGVKQVRTFEHENVQLASVLDEVPFNDPDYIPGETISKINAAWNPLNPADFCAPGGYQHCGKDCGYNGSRGGGAPINELDSCCIAHDRCWENIGAGDCTCDGYLNDCARKYRDRYWVVANAIIAYFKGC